MHCRQEEGGSKCKEPGGHGEGVHGVWTGGSASIDHNNAVGWQYLYWRWVWLPDWETAIICLRPLETSVEINWRGSVCAWYHHHHHHHINVGRSGRARVAVGRDSTAPAIRMLECCASGQHSEVAAGPGRGSV